MTGLELKIQRVSAEVKAKELAAALGVSPSRLSAIEGSRKVTPEMGERYRATLRNLLGKAA